ncbi:EF-hand domain-containing protein [Hyphobacterium sp.]|uniref:EF-hand domain-containing protein n=1 Tax=Hyphobacterium sp. TaxID=2004662 RepID=UPI003B525B66
MTKRNGRFEKKSEMIEVRISHAQKQALLSHCRRQGLSASEAVRGMISGELSSQSRRMVFNLERITTMPSFFKSHPRKAAAASIAVLSAALLSFAAPGQANDGAAVFAAMDSNADSHLTEAEFMAVVRREGLVWNPNADPNAARRTVGMSELEGSARREFARYDRNRDGRITHYEFTGRYVPLMRASFLALDRNVDAYVSVSELAVSLGSIGFESADAPEQSAEQLVDELDLDNDGQLSFDEFLADS